MKTWKLVSGILSILLFFWVVFQSFAAGLVNTFASTGEVSGTVGLLVAVVLLVGGIVSIATRNTGKGGDIALLIIFGIGALLGFPSSGGVFKDLLVWAFWCLICAVLAVVDLVLKSRTVQTVSVKKTAGTISQGPLFCSSCGNKLERTWKTCPFCGEVVSELELSLDDQQEAWEETQLPDETNRTKGIQPIFLVIGAAVGTILLLLIILYIVSGGGSTSDAESEEHLADAKDEYQEDQEENDPPRELAGVDLAEYAGQDVQKLIDANLALDIDTSDYGDAYDTTTVLSEDDRIGTILIEDDNGNADKAPMLYGVSLGMSRADAIAVGKNQFPYMDENAVLNCVQFYRAPGDTLLLDLSKKDTVSRIQYMYDAQMVQDFINSQNAAPATVAEGATIYDVDYIFPESNSRYLSSEEINSVDNNVKQMAINEIYARYGRRFNTQEIQAYFDTKPWYAGTIDPAAFNEAVLNDYERENVKALSNSMGNVAVDYPITNYNAEHGF